MNSIMLLLAQSNGGAGGGSAGGTAAALGGGLFFIIFIILALATTIFWIWMLIDCITSSKPSTEKLIWVLVIIFTHIIGAVLYFLLGRGNRSVV